MTSRRSFLKIAGASIGGASLAGAGLYALLRGEEQEVLQQPKKKPTRISNPQYQINPEISEGICKELLPYIETLLGRFYEPNPLSVDEIADQVAYIRTIKDMKYKKGGKINVHEKQAQALLLPFQPEKKPHKYFFVTAMHCLKEFDKNSPHMLTSTKEHPHVSLIDIIAYSKVWDLAFGWCTSNQLLNVQRVGFTQDCNLDDEIYVIPSSSPSEKERKPLSGKVTEGNGSHFYTDINIRKGYSGSPAVIDGHVAGIAVGTPIKKRPGINSLIMGSRQLEQMLQHYVRTVKK